jgi:kinesin family protein 1
MEQTHDVVAWMQICELGPDGHYVPVPVISQGYADSGSFSLHQGLQRRIILRLASNSGRQLPWSEVTRIRLGNIRLLDAKGRIHDSASKPLVTLPLLQHQEVVFKPDGTGELTAEALWDSSVHDSILLNRVTAAHQRILLQLNWAIAVDTCAEPVQFTTDVAISIQTRDARAPSKFMSFLGSVKILTKTSTVFHVRLTPPLTRSAKDLWRLDTSEKYVRGEETLSTWKPRGISVVEDYSRLVTMERRAADVQAIRVILASSLIKHSGQSGVNIWGGDEILRKSVDLWQKKFGHRGEVCIFCSSDPSDRFVTCTLLDRFASGT